MLLNLARVLSFALTHILPQTIGENTISCTFRAPERPGIKACTILHGIISLATRLLFRSQNPRARARIYIDESLPGARSLARGIDPRSRLFN